MGRYCLADGTYMGMTIRERLAAKLVRMPNGCLEWTGHGYGYGRISVFGVEVRTHRLAWELAFGPIPPGMKVLHHCDNPPCCETEPTEGYPEGHLFLGTDAENAADRNAKGRSNNGNQDKTRCPQRHAYDEANTYIDKHGKRYCRACNRAAAARYAARRKVTVQL
jgi:hypothetical protein